MNDIESPVNAFPENDQIPIEKIPQMQQQILIDIDEIRTYIADQFGKVEMLNFDTDELNTRKRLSEEVMNGLETLDGVTGSLDSIYRQKAINVRDFVMNLLEHVVRSRDDLLHPSMIMKEAYYEAQLLEIFRREMFDSQYVCIEHFDGVPSYDDEAFWDRIITEKVDKNISLTELMESRRKQSDKIISTRSVEEWSTFVQNLDDYSIDYIRGRIERVYGMKDMQASLLKRLSKEGERLATPEDIQEIDQSLLTLKERLKRMYACQTLDELLVLMRTKKGSSAGFGDLLAILSY